MLENKMDKLREALEIGLKDNERIEFKYCRYGFNR